MKTTMEIPDELYRRVKAKSALEGRAVREVTESLYRAWLGEEGAPAGAPTADAWLAEWIAAGRDVLREAPPGPTATELVAEGRRRHEAPQPVLVVDALIERAGARTPEAWLAARG